MKTVKLLGRFGLGFHGNTEAVLECAKELLAAKQGEKIFIDFSDLEFLYPSGINTLVVIGNYLMQKRGCSIKQNFPKDAEAKNFLIESGFSHTVGIKVNRDESAAPHNGSRIYKVRQFTMVDDYQIEKLIDVIEKELELSQVVRFGVHENLAELISNVIEHSESPLPCYVMGQGYVITDRIRFCIADAGIGIKNHLGKRYTELLDKNSVEAIEMALQEGITGTLDNKNSGVGLSYFRQFIDICKGSFVILSGDGMYSEKWSDSEKKVNKEKINFEFPGTLIDVTINSQPGLKMFSATEPIPNGYKLIE